MLEAGHVDAQREQGAHDLLDRVAHHGLGQDRVELLRHRRRVQVFAADVDAVARVARPRPPPAPGRRARCGPGSRSSGRPAPCALSERIEVLGDLARGGRHDDLARSQTRERIVRGVARRSGARSSEASPDRGGRGPTRTGAALGGLAQEAGRHQLLEALPHRLHLVAREGCLGGRQVPASERQVGHVDVERHIGHQRDDPGVAARQRLVVGQVLPELRRQLAQVPVDPIEVAVGRQQFGGGLLAHSGYAGQVVGGVAAQRRQQHVLRRWHAAALEDPGLVVERVVGHPPPVVEDPDVGVARRAGSCHDPR